MIQLDVTRGASTGTWCRTVLPRNCSLRDWNLSRGFLDLRVLKSQGDTPCREVPSTLGRGVAWPLHGLELVNPLLGVALPDLPQRLVLVPTLPHVLVVDEVIVGPLILIPGLGQLVTQGLQHEARICYLPVMMLTW